MSRIRLRLSLTILTTLIVWLIFGFSFISLQHQKTVTIKIVLPALQAPFWSELITDFQKKNSKITIELVEAADDTNLVEDYYVQKSGKQKSLRSDLVYMDIIWVPYFAEEGLLMNLSTKMSKEELNELEADFLKKDWEGGHYKNNLYRIPFHSDIGLLFYRKDLLKDPGGLPETFEELMEKSRKLQKEGLRGYIWQGKQYEGLVATFVEVLTGYGGFWINDKHKVGLDKDPAFIAAKFLRNTIKHDGISPSEVTTSTERDTISMLKKGEAVFLRDWLYWTETNGPGSEIQDKYNFVPMLHGGNKKSGGCQGGWGLGIAESSTHKKEALKALKFFTSVATQKKYALKSGNMPSRRSLFNDLQLVKRYSYYPKLLEISQNSVLRPPIPNYSAASKILQEHLTFILKNAETITDKQIEDKMKEAAKKTRELLEKSH